MLNQEKQISPQGIFGTIIMELLKNAADPILLSCADENGNLTPQVKAGIKADWNRTSTKGYLGETLVRDLLHRYGLVVYKPDTEQPHAFDLLAIREKKETLLVECKSKPRRMHYCDTGIDLEQYKIYQQISKELDSELFLTFVDESMGEVYGNLLSELSKPHVDAFGNRYPLIQNDIVYFSLESMQHHLAHLDDGTIAALKKVSSGSYYSVGR